MSEQDRHALLGKLFEEYQAVSRDLELCDIALAKAAEDVLLFAKTLCKPNALGEPLSFRERVGDLSKVWNLLEEQKILSKRASELEGQLKIKPRP